MIHLITNAHGLPMKTRIRGGDVSDDTSFDLLCGGSLTAPKVFIVDKGKFQTTSAKPCPAQVVHPP